MAEEQSTCADVEDDVLIPVGAGTRRSLRAELTPVRGPLQPALHGAREPIPEAQPAPRPLTKGERDTARLLAGLIDGQLEARNPERTSTWAAAVLGEDEAQLSVSGQWLSGLALQSAASMLHQHLPQAVAVQDAAGGPVPVFDTVEGSHLQIPASLRAHFPAGQLCEVPVAVAVTQEAAGSGLLTRLWLFATRGRTGMLQTLARELRTKGLQHHPDRSQILQVTTAGRELNVGLADLADAPRQHLILPQQIWEELDRNLHGLLARRELLERLGLGLNRGVLLHGPPGTGKTQLARTYAHELAGQVTVLLADAEVMRTSMNKLYNLARTFSPSLVILEDIDLVISRRGTGNDATLIDFLTSLDGIMNDHSGVLTLATTNSVGRLDDAVTRAARFDRIIEIPLPDAEGRQAIWRHYLTALDLPESAITQLAQTTEAASGAQIREIVRHTVLATDTHPTVSDLLRYARDVHTGSSNHGQYL